MITGIVYGALLILTMASSFFAVLAWVVLFVSSVVTDTSPVDESAPAKSYPYGCTLSIVTGVVWAVGWGAFYTWLRGDHYPYRVGAMTESVFYASVALCVAMVLLGYRLNRIRRSRRNIDER